MAHLLIDYLANLKKLTIIDLNLVKSVDLVNELPAYLVIAASSVDSMTMFVIIGSNCYYVDLMNFIDPTSKLSFKNYFLYIINNYP